VSARPTPKPVPQLADLPGLTPASSIEPMLTLDGLARVLSCDRRTIERMRAAGKLPRADLIIGRRSPRWRPETVRGWLERGGAA
jgi:hypothetical protein